MKLNFKKRHVAVCALGFAVGISACGKKKSDTKDEPKTEKADSVDGVVTAGTLALSISDTINIFPPKTEAAALKLAEVDDAKSKVSYRVTEMSTEGLMQAQGILCFLSQTRYPEMANQGPYIALVNESKCFKDGDANSGVRITRTKVESTREDGKAILVKLWLPGEEGKSGMHVRLQVAEGSSESNPIGIFRLQFSDGYLESRRNAEGKIEVSFFEDQTREGEGSWKMKMGVRLDQEASGKIIGGRMAVESAESWGEQSKSSNFNVAFNDNYINRAGSANGEAADACLDRNKFASRAYMYNVYKADGSLWDLNSGFPIEFEESGVVKYGYASYWGVSGQEGNISSAVTNVSRVDYSSGSKVTTPYTVKSAPGKLVKHEKKKITLAALTGTELQQWGQNGMTVVKWDGSKFNKVATVKWEENGEVRTPVSGLAEKDQWSDGYRFNVPSLDGDIFIPSDKATNTFEVAYHSRTTVSGTDQVPTGALLCFDSCFEMAPTAESFKQQGFGSSQGPFKLIGSAPNQTNVAETLVTKIAEYTWDTATHNLKSGNAFFTLPSFGSDNGQYSQISGALVPVADWNALSAGDKEKSPYELESMVNVFYRFETGNQSWNQFTALVDSEGKTFNFDQPVNLTYVHSKENDLNAPAESEFYGQTFSLQYGGKGSLWGIPGDKDKSSNQYMPKFSLAIGASLSDGAVAIPVEIEQLPSTVDAGLCGEVPLSDIPAVPTTPAEKVDNGTEPADDTTPLKVNEGELI